MLLGTIYSMRPLQDQSALPGQKTNKKNINGEHYVARHIPQRSAQTHSDRVHTEKSFQNSQTFHKPLQYSIGSGRAFCSEIGSFCLKHKSGIFVNGIIYDNETKERTFLFLLVLM